MITTAWYLILFHFTHLFVYIIVSLPLKMGEKKYIIKRRLKRLKVRALHLLWKCLSMKTLGKDELCVNSLLVFVVLLEMNSHSYMYMLPLSLFTVCVCVRVLAPPAESVQVRDWGLGQDEGGGVARLRWCWFLSSTGRPLCLNCVQSLKEQRPFLGPIVFKPLNSRARNQWELVGTSLHMFTHLYTASRLKDISTQSYFHNHSRVIRFCISRMHLVCNSTGVRWTVKLDFI